MYVSFDVSTYEFTHPDASLERRERSRSRSRSISSLSLSWISFPLTARFSLHPFLALPSPHYFFVVFCSLTALFSLAMVGGAASSSCYASPLCTWFVAACMSVSHGGGDSRQAVSLKSTGRSRRSRRQLTKCLALSGSGSVQEALVTTSFGPCNHYNALSSLFGSNSVSLNRNQRRLNLAAASSGN